MTDKFVPHSTSQQSYHSVQSFSNRNQRRTSSYNKNTALENYSEDDWERGRASTSGAPRKSSVMGASYANTKGRKASFLYATQLTQEHQKNRVALSMTPQQKAVIKRHDQKVEDGCQMLNTLLTRLKLGHRFKHFSRRKITYARAKNMNAREFAALGLSHAEALRLANTLSYAGAIQNSYDDASQNYGNLDTGEPILFRDASEQRVQRIANSSGRSPNTQKKHQKRLSALGRDLLDVFSEQVKPVNRTDAGRSIHDRYRGGM